MKILQILFCTVILVEFCNCIPIKAEKEKKAVKLSYSCMRVTQEGENKQKAPILLLHGLASFKESWMGLYQILALKTGRRVCAADLRNHGDSPWSDDADVESMALDIKLLLQTLKTDKVVLLGHSLGGKLSVHFTLNNPDKVEKLVVEDMRPNGATDEANRMVLGALTRFKEAIESLPKGITEKEAKRAVYDYLVKNMGHGFQMEDRAVDYLPIRCTKGQCEWKTNFKLFEKLSKQDPGQLLTKSTGLFEKPALFIYGKISPFKIPDAKDEIEKLFPKAKLVGIEGAGHRVNSFPGYRDSVIEFINQED